MTRAGGGNLSRLRSREDVAIALLQSPEAFPALPARTEFDRLLCLWRLPSFSPHASWSLFRRRDADGFVVRRLMHDPSRGLPVDVDDPHVHGAEGLVATTAGERVLTAFAALRFPVFERYPGVGLDGTRYGIRTGNRYGGACIEWWEGGPAGWTPLADLFDDTIRRFEAILPAATLA